MSVKIGWVEYTPGYYGKKRPNAVEQAHRCISRWAWEKAHRRKRIPPCICLSRKIGSGALEVADTVARRLGLLVVDRELLETMAYTEPFHEEILHLFEKRYPHFLDENLSRVFSKGVFVKNDTTEHLFSIIMAVAGLGSTIFVGRGTHLVLPRDRVLAVRFVSSKEFRTERLKKLLHVGDVDVREALSRLDEEQKLFFEETFKEIEASPYEFDLVINRDHVKKAEWAANVVTQAFTDKFGMRPKG
jgi:cytidylate kinase